MSQLCVHVRGKEPIYGSELNFDGLHAVVWERDTEVARSLVRDVLSVEVTKTDFLAEVRATHPAAYSKWTEAEENNLAKLVQQGLVVEEIAAAMGRQPGGIVSRMSRLGLVPPAG